ncbi:hypothetical protein HYV83_01500 [Candidatus Woesearchaeota archaeon]|nr:hypothetical protein [Candidatus Woesearchaeota archaeon]
MKAENFIKHVEEIKGKGQLDLSLGEDLSIGIMNLISLEEHFLFSFVKTNNGQYLPMLEQTRELRKRLLKKIVRDNKGEDWCISKHLLAATMRLTEVGTKYLHDGRQKEAEEMFIEAFNLYSLFWAINSPGSIKNSGSETRAVDSGTEKSKLSKIAEAFKKLIDCCKE